MMSLAVSVWAYGVELAIARTARATSEKTWSICMLKTGSSNLLESDVKFKSKSNDG